VSTYRLIYVSRVARQVRFADAEEIARDAATKNAGNRVTGVLVYTPSLFIQVLEGQQSEVEATFARIEKDPRHQQVRVLAAHEVDASEFDAWAMVARRIRALKNPAIDELTVDTALQILRDAQGE
jgi:Sensors of blue-light using FAD